MDKKFNNNTLILFLIFLSVFVAFGTNYVCPWRRFFHIYCAGCGVTRMVKAILILDFYQAFRYNQLFFVLLFLLINYLLYITVCKILNFSYFKFGYNYLWILLILVISYTILRNIEMFNYLVPTEV